MARPVSLTEEELKSIIVNSLVAGLFKHTKHLFDQIPDRNLSTRDVRYICQNGKLVEALWHDDRNQWHYELRCKALDGIETSVIVAISDDQYYAVAITTY